MTTVRCAYCNWVGQEPSPAEYPTDEAYWDAYAEFRASHDNYVAAVEAALDRCEAASAARKEKSRMPQAANGE